MVEQVDKSIKYTLQWRYDKVKHGLTMLKPELDKLVTLDEQDEMLVILSLDNLFNSVMTTYEVIKNLKRGIKHV